MSERPLKIIDGRGGSYFALRIEIEHQYIWNNINYLCLGRNFYGNYFISVDRRVYYCRYNGNLVSLLLIWIYMKYMLDFILPLSSIPTISQNFHW